MTTAYKVVRRTASGRLRSLAMDARTRFSARYIPQQRCLPLPPTKLFAFETQAGAVWWAGGQDDNEVWQVQATGVAPLDVMLAIPKPSEITSFWDLPQELRCSSLFSCSPPMGTVACDSITLIKRVDGDG